MNVSPWSIVALFGGVLAFLVGLPLLTVWVRRQPWWLRMEARSVDPGPDVTERFRLRPAEVSQVRTAVRRGRELTDPRLRGATVAWATALAEAADRVPRRTVPVAVVWGVAGVAALALLVARTGVDGLVGPSLAWAVLGFFAVRQTRARDRAVRLNSDQPGWSPSGSGPDGDRVAGAQRE